MLFVLYRPAEMIIHPKRLFSAAVFSLSLGMVSSYVADHDHAERTLAIRQGPPDAVALQDYDGRSAGPLGEVTLRAEVDVRELTIVPAPLSYGTGELCVLPLYPVSSRGAALIGATRDAKSSPVSAQLSRRLPLSEPSSIPLAVLIRFVPAGTPHPPMNELFTQNFGNGRNGRVVELNGLLRKDGDAVPLIEAAFAGLGHTVPERAPVIHPFSENRLAEITQGAVREAPVPFFQIGILLMIAAIMVALHDHGYFDGLQARRKRAEAIRRLSPALAARRANTAHPQFAPIPSQEEILARAVDPDDIERTLFQRQFPILSMLSERLAEIVRSRLSHRAA